jgi:hypothetical protein
VNVPSFDKMLRPILALAAQAPTTRAIAADAMIAHFSLSKEDQDACIPSGKATYVRNRAGWAMTFLTKGGLIQKVAPRQYGATQRGREFLSSKPDSITVSDLASLEGWQEAWRPSPSTEDEPDIGDDDPAAIETRIRVKLERAIPEPGARADALEFLAFAIESADEERADAWTLRELGDGLELKAGRLVAVRIRSRRIGVSLMGPLSDEQRAALGTPTEEDEPWARVPGGLWVKVPAERASALSVIKDLLAMFIDAAIARVRREIDLDDHSREAIAFVSKQVGRELPQPEARPQDSKEDSKGGEGEDIETSREPQVRGRAPIFEHGQRAIASLIEDINPERGTIALPDLQRPFVWEDTKVRELLDSLFIGFPVGTLVLWHTSDTRDSRAIGSANRALRATTLVIDGQQRLTSLFAVMRGKEVASKDGSKRTITIAFRPRDGRFEVADAAIRKDPEFLANVTELWNGPRTKVQIRKDLLKALQTSGREISEEYADALETNLERAHAIQDYRFPTVEIRKTTSAEEVSEEDVADIFVRINNQGSRLGHADFVLTLLSVYHDELRDRIEISARDMSADAIVTIDTQQLLRTACAVGFGRARMSAVYRFLRGVDPTTGDANPAGRAERLSVLDSATAECLDKTSWRDYMLRVMHAGFVSPGLVASTNAITNAYAFYILGRRSGVPKQTLEQCISRWIFATLLSARYSSSSETKYEEDLARVRDIPSVSTIAFVETLDNVLSNILTDDFWSRTAPAALETQRARAPTALAFRAAQVVLGARALFSDQLLQNLLAPPGKGGRAASEMHHLFPKDWLRRQGVADHRLINQVANLADVGWHENGSVGSENPAKYVPRIRDKLSIDDDRWGRMCAEHALPLGWEVMKYEEFLAARRPRMAEIIRIAYRTLGGEPGSLPLTPPWFLPGAESVWKRIGEAELRLRAAVRSVYSNRFGHEAGSALVAALDGRERESLERASRNLPAGAERLGLVDYLYIGQLPGLLFRPDVWAEARSRFSGDQDIKKKLQQAIELIVPVRNEIAHVREVSQEKLQRANLACGDLLSMMGEGGP